MGARGRQWKTPQRRRAALITNGVSQWAARNTAGTARLPHARNEVLRYRIRDLNNTTAGNGRNGERVFSAVPINGTKEPALTLGIAY
jgi:hypothetical protein